MRICSIAVTARHYNAKSRYDNRAQPFHQTQEIRSKEQLAQLVNPANEQQRLNHRTLFPLFSPQPPPSLMPGPSPPSFLQRQEQRRTEQQPSARVAKDTAGTQRRTEQRSSTASSSSSSAAADAAPLSDHRRSSSAARRTPLTENATPTLLLMPLIKL